MIPPLARHLSPTPPPVTHAPFVCLFVCLLITEFLTPVPTLMVRNIHLDTLLHTDNHTHIHTLPLWAITSTLLVTSVRCFWRPAGKQTFSLSHSLTLSNTHTNAGWRVTWHNLTALLMHSPSLQISHNATTSRQKLQQVSAASPSSLTVADGFNRRFMELRGWKTKRKTDIPERSSANKTGYQVSWRAMTDIMF